MRGASGCFETDVGPSPVHFLTQRVTFYGPGINASSFQSVVSHYLLVMSVVAKYYGPGHHVLKRISAASNFDGTLLPHEHPRTSCPSF